MSGYILNGNSADNCPACDPKITRSLSEHFLPTSVPSGFSRSEFTFNNDELSHEQHATSPGSVDQADARSVTREPISGFVLISVKHTSRASRKKPVKNSGPSAQSEQLDRSSADSPVGNSSPNSSLSSTNGDQSRYDVYGSGSVEAEEFDDDDPEEEDSATEIHETLVGGLCAGQLAGGFHLNGLQLGQLTPRSPVFAKSKLPLHLVNPGSGDITPRVPKSSGLSSHLVPYSRRFLSGSAYSQASSRNGHSYPLHMPTPHGMFSPEPRLIPVVQSANGGLQLNNSHIGSQLLSQLATNTAHAFNHVSPQHTHGPPDHMTEPTAAVGESHLRNNTESLHSQGSAPLELVDQASLYSHFEHTQYGRSHTPCRHYLRSTTDPLPSHLMISRATVEDTAAVVAGLDSVEATLAAAASSLPPLQPASRFRKARIHETVEQWAHGRASIHDCRLRTIPEWVSELQKKSVALERDLHTALEHKFNCYSCLEMKTLESNPPDPQVMRIAARAKAVPPLTPQQQQPAQSPSKSSDVSQQSLFTFWDAGSRVHHRSMPPAVGRVVPIPECPAVVSEDVESSCVLCVQPCIQPNGTAPLVPAPDQLQFNQTTDSNSNRLANDHNTSTMDSSVANTTLQNSAVTSANTDPATAYLRRHCNTGDTRNPTITQGPTGSEHVPRVGEPMPVAIDPGALRLHTESSPQLSPDAVNYLARLHSPFPPGLESAPHLSLTQIYPSNESDNSVQDSIGGLGKPNVTGLVPPTSPTFTDVLDLPPSLSTVEAPAQPNTRVDLPTELYRTSLPGNITISAVRFPAASGNYQNVGTNQSGPAVGYSLMNGALSTAPPTFVPVTGATESRQMIPTGPSHPSLSAQSGSEALLVDVHGDTQPKLISTFDLEARITRSMDTIRSAMEQAFQRELAAVHSENVRLASEVERLTREVSQLRGYQAAFYALQPFVNQEMWDHLQQQSQPKLSHPDSTPPQTSQPPAASSMHRQS